MKKVVFALISVVVSAYVVGAYADFQVETSNSVSMCVLGHCKH